MSSRNEKRLPSEWEKHKATWLCWPSNPSDWPGALAGAQAEFLEFAKAVLRFEPLNLLIPENADGLEARLRSQLLQAESSLSIYKLDTNRSWLRDSGPIFFKQGGKVYALSCNFNAWAKYSDFELDSQVASFISSKSGLPLVKAHIGGAQPFVMEGGAIDSNGAGSVFLTRQCMLSNTQQRNPGLSESDCQKFFEQYLGVHQLIWLEGGIGGDDTHGHIDDVCRFTSPSRCLLVQPSLADNEGMSFFEANRKVLAETKVCSGEKLEFDLLPAPEPMFFQGEILPASYANFYLINGAVLVPVFSCKQDKEALRIISNHFPSREVVPVSSRELIYGLGSLHCLSLHQPEP